MRNRCAVSISCVIALGFRRRMKELSELTAKRHESNRRVMGSREAVAPQVHNNELVGSGLQVVGRKFNHVAPSTIHNPNKKQKKKTPPVTVGVFRRGENAPLALCFQIIYFILLLPPIPSIVS
jgi:hypothetical protein